MKKNCSNCQHSYWTWDAIAEHIDDLICELKNCKVGEDFICEHYEKDEVVYAQQEAEGRP